MKSKRLHDRVSPVSGEVVERIRHRFDDCKAEFLIWARSTRLDTAGMWEGEEPVFRPAVRAWSAWQAAWKLLTARPLNEGYPPSTYGGREAKDLTKKELVFFVADLLEVHHWYRIEIKQLRDECDELRTKVPK